ncbi:MAG: 4Fe-4S binding protein [Chromatiales bacterium]|nr:4Fe-4S binding protein [Chromatiales bacterium]
MSCRYACPTRAIGADARSRPAIAAEACNGCGKCVRGCPTQAISVTAAMADAVPGR